MPSTFPSNYALIATLGPASERPELWHALLAAGATGFRLNTSHLSPAELGGWLERLEGQHFLQEERHPVVLDLQGSKWRLGTFPPFELIAGDPLELVLAASSEQSGVLPVPHADFFRAARLSDGEIVLNDARSRLVVEHLGDERLRARVTLGGPISSRKGITFAASEFRLEALGTRDQAIVEMTRPLGWIQYAVSYVRDAAEMARYRRLIGTSAHLIAKLERRPALADLPALAQSADALWLCRGDLGAELGLAAMAEAVFEFTARLAELPVPALIAGQVLEHMSEHASPTRAELCDLYAALARGYAGCVLSDETAIGHFPLEACRAAAMWKSRG